MQVLLTMVRVMKKSIALLLAGLIVTQPVYADDAIVCPPETHTAMSAATLAMKDANGKDMYGVNVADYLSGQLCFGLNLGAAMGVSAALSCRDMETLPQHTKTVLRKRDCPNYVPPVTTAPAPVAPSLITPTTPTQSVTPTAITPNIIAPASR